MKHSEQRILTTHAGSLPRPSKLAEMFGRLSHHEPVDNALLERAIEESTRRVVRMQSECGIDVGNNGEQSRESFFTYVQHRMSGFGGRSERPRIADIWNYPSFLDVALPFRAAIKVDLLHAPKAVGEVRYIDRRPLEKECDDFLKIVGETKPGFTECFMTSPSPGIIASAMLNEHYPSFEDYVTAVADAVKVEYEAIASRGMVLQIDAPDLALEHHTSYAQRPLKDFLGFVDLIVAAINRALENVPRDCVRLHVCWGIRAPSASSRSDGYCRSNRHDHQLHRTSGGGSRPDRTTRPRPRGSSSRDGIARLWLRNHDWRAHGS